MTKAAPPIPKDERGVDVSSVPGDSRGAGSGHAYDGLMIEDTPDPLALEVSRIRSRLILGLVGPDGDADLALGLILRADPDPSVISATADDLRRASADHLDTVAQWADEAPTDREKLFYADTGIGDEGRLEEYLAILARAHRIAVFITERKHLGLPL